MISDNIKQGLVIQFTDLNYLDEKQLAKLQKVLSFINRKRAADGLSEETYLIINVKAPYADRVVGLILAEEAAIAQEVDDDYTS